MRVAVETSRPVASVASDPYVLTLWTFEHVQQSDYFGGLKHRGHALNGASLMSIAFHEPKKLTEEHRKLMSSAGLVKIATVDEHRALVEEMRTMGWK